jgi:hypothetical protein
MVQWPLRAALFLAVLSCGAAQAAPVELQYSGIVGDSSYGYPTGVSLGDTITFDVFADNGGTGLDSQTWTWSDITSATITAGTYSATTSGPVSGGSDSGTPDYAFDTNASGQLIYVYFGTFQNGTDTNGNSTFAYYMEGLNDLWYVFGSSGGPVGSFGAIDPPNGDNTTISLTSATPLPATLPLFAGGLGMIGLLGARKRRKAQVA